jgi:hypothetical protein
MRATFAEFGLNSMKFPAFSLLAGNFLAPESGGCDKSPLERSAFQTAWLTRSVRWNAAHSCAFIP